MKRVAVVTGANGFCGQHLTAHLRAARYEVVGIDSRGEPGQGPVKYRADILETDRIAVVLAETKPDCVFHLAALTNPRLEYSELHRVNALGTLSLLRAVRRSCPAAAVVVTSSSAVYGPMDSDKSPIKEDQPFRPVSAYGVSKVAQEMTAYQQYAEHGLRVIRVRPFNLTGPGESSNFVTSAFARQIADIADSKREPVLEVGNLETIRDFTDVRDAVVAYRLLAEQGLAGEAYNVCSGRGVPIRSLLEMLVATAGISSPRIVTKSARRHKVDVPIQVGSYDGIQRCTGWRPTISLHRTLRELLDSRRQRHGASG